MFDPLKDLTIVVGVDANTWKQFCLSVQTWKLNRPEMWSMPWVVFYDHSQLSFEFVSAHLIGTFDIPNFKTVAWPPDNVRYESQREKMLSGHVYIPGMYVETEWHAKIDTDVVAHRRDDWLPAEWFEQENGVLPAYVAPRWHYTKGAGFLQRLEEWGDSQWQMLLHPRLNIEQKPDQLRVGHSRMCSWVSYYNTRFSQWVMDCCAKGCGDYKLPVPSQDSTVWYAAARMGMFHRIKNQKAVSWNNYSRFEELRKQVAEILNAAGT